MTTKALNFVIGEIIAFDSRDGQRPDALPDIERVVSAVELLQERGDLEVAPFVSSWDPVVDALERSAPAASLMTEVEDLARAFGITGGGFGGTASGRYNRTNAQRAMERLIDKRIGGHRVDIFGNLHQKLVQQLVALLHLGDESTVAYLSPLLEAGRAAALHVATLNYDLCVETCARRNGLLLSTGIGTWAANGRLDFPDTGIRLYKIHGSIDWERQVQHLEDQVLRMPQTTPSPPAHDAAYSRTPFVIYGQREKLRPQGPFLQLLEEFRRAADSARDLVIVGYGFGDPHINEFVTQWVNGEPSRRLTVIDPSFPASWTGGWIGVQDYRTTLLRSLQRQDGRVVNNITETRLAVVRQPASAALARMFSTHPRDFIDKAFQETVTIGTATPEANPESTADLSP